LTKAGTLTPFPFNYHRSFKAQRTALRTELDAVGADLIELNSQENCAEVLTLFFRNRLRRTADESGG
jgi:hypothetical protein